MKPLCLSAIACVLLVVRSSLGLPEEILIGGLFDSEDNTLETAFRYAVEKVNSNIQKQPVSTKTKPQPKFRLSARIVKIPKDDSFQASQQVCGMLRSGVAAIFGPQSEMTASHVQSICDTLEIPHIEARWDVRQRRDGFSVNLYPHPSSLSRAFASLVQMWDWWKSFTVIYEDNESLVRLQEIIKLNNKWKIKMKQLSPDGNYRPMLREIKNSGESNILIDCSTANVHSVLKQAQQIGMVTEHQNYIITNLDLHTLNLEDFKYGNTNITGFRLVDPTKPEVQAVISDWKYGELLQGRKLNISEHGLTTEAALIYDAVHLFTKALLDLDQSQDIEIKPLSCESDVAWVSGNSLINYMKLVEAEKLTGNIKFGTEGFRTDFTLDIVKLTEDGLSKIGQWKGSNLTFAEARRSLIDDDMKKVFKVTSRFGEPYFINRTSEKVLTGNEKYDGFVVDVMEEIAKIINISYIFHPVKDNQYGSYVEAKDRWNGMVGEVMYGEADMAIADLTITRKRQEVVDFTLPFLNLGIGVLYRKPVKQPPSLFSFMSPFALTVWIGMSLAYLGVTLVLFILARFSPTEWDNPYPCIQDPEELENSFTMLNSFWFTIGSLMQQGSDIAPKAVSTRMVAGMWWFFTLIMISSYTANLAAFLTVEQFESPFKSAREMADQSKVKYGCVTGGSTYNFFQFSSIDWHQKLWNFMSANPDVFTTGNPEGTQRVQDRTDYAFFMESAGIEFIVQRHCDLRQVGETLDSKGYGIALRRGSELRTKLSNAILKLQEDAIIHRLRKKWWEEMLGAGKCGAVASGGGGAEELGIDNLGGVFVVLMGGMGVSCVIAVLEFIWHTRKVVRKGRGSLCNEIMTELKFFLQCHVTTKPIRKASVSEQENGIIVPLTGYSGFSGKEALT